MYDRRPYEGQLKGRLGELLNRLLLKEKPVMIGIDGRCGSGKTGLAWAIADCYPCNVLHMDDFYLPFEKRAKNWMEIPGGNMDFQRLRRELLIPVTQGKTAVYRAYVCREDRYEEAVCLPAHKLTVVEGSYSHHPDLGAEYDLRIFLTCSAPVQRMRLEKRSKDHLEEFENKWIPMEERYFKSYSTKEKSNLVICTDGFF